MIARIRSLIHYYFSFKFWKNSAYLMCTYRTCEGEIRFAAAATGGKRFWSHHLCPESGKETRPTRILVRVNSSVTENPEYVQRIDGLPIQTTTNRKMALAMGDSRPKMRLSPSRTPMQPRVGTVQVSAQDGAGLLGHRYKASSLRAGLLIGSVTRKLRSGTRTCLRQKYLSCELRRSAWKNSFSRRRKDCARG